MGALHMQIWSYNLHKLLTFHHLGGLYIPAGRTLDKQQYWKQLSALNSRVLSAQAGTPVTNASTASQGLASIFTLAFCCHTESILLWRLISSAYTFTANFGIYFWQGSNCSPTGKRETNICFPGQQFGFADVFASPSLTSRPSNKTLPVGVSIETC